MARTTMLDLTKRRHGAKEVGLIEANLSYAPELGLFPARTIEGTSYTTLLRVGLPTVAFAHLNGGVDASKSRYERSEGAYNRNKPGHNNSSGTMAFKEGMRLLNIILPY